ncbi:MAG TPA: Asp/Glu racemase [Mycobacteriales bacterium]|nr:Asp/Glu racemase [Mycobacteriales bacterium]
MADRHRVGLIVPSSNVTMETELPALLGEYGADRRFTFHSSRAVLHRVDAESLRRMVGESDRCAAELADARVEVVAYACLVAVMAEGAGAHDAHEARLTDRLRAAGCDAPVVSSAGALVRTLQELDAHRVAMIAPYMKPLTAKVAAYLEAYGFDVIDSLSLEVDDNLAVGALDPSRLVDHLGRVRTDGADAVILSACVQMPSLEALQPAADAVGLPVISAASSTARELLAHFGIDATLPGAQPSRAEVAAGSSAYDVAVASSSRTARGRPRTTSS